MSTLTLTWVVWGALAALTVVGAVGVLASRETMRLILSLGTFLLGVAGLYLFYAMPLLATAQLFLYVGGVLVLFLFAITALRREGEGAELPRTFDLVAASIAISLFAIMSASLLELGRTASVGPVAASGTEEVAELLLGSLLPQFEIVGMVLLVALVAALAIAGRGDEE